MSKKTKREDRPHILPVDHILYDVISSSCAVLGMSPIKFLSFIFSRGMESSTVRTIVIEAYDDKKKEYESVIPTTAKKV